MDTKRLTLKEIEALVAETTRHFEGIRTEDLPTYGYSRDGAYPHIEVDENGYHWVVVERGEELERKTFLQMDDLLYRILDSVTFSLAQRWEGWNRKRDEDFRRQLFAKRLELMNSIRPDFREKLKAEIQKILEKAPFDDPKKRDSIWHFFKRLWG